jgi:hypothetical protein
MLWELQVQALDYRMHFIIADTQIALSGSQRETGDNRLKKAGALGRPTYSLARPIRTAGMQFWVQAIASGWTIFLKGSS